MGPKILGPKKFRSKKFRSNKFGPKNFRAKKFGSKKFGSQKIQVPKIQFQKFGSKKLVSKIWVQEFRSIKFGSKKLVLISKEIKRFKSPAASRHGKVLYLKVFRAFKFLSDNCQQKNQQNWCPKWHTTGRRPAAEKSASPVSQQLSSPQNLKMEILEVDRKELLTKKVYFGE